MLGEKIPPMLLAQEINYVQDVMNTPELDDLLAISGGGINRLRAFCGKEGIHSIVETIREISSKYGDMNGAGMLMLKPKLSSSMTVDRGAAATAGDFWLRNVHTNKVLAVFGDFEMLLLSRCNGSSTVGEVIAALGDEYDAADCIAFLRSLWELRVVCLQKLIQAVNTCSICGF